MRTIEQKMREAIEQKRDFKMSNTEVITRNLNGGSVLVSFVYLFGHEIACYYHHNGGLMVNTKTLRAWPSNTTISRLRALGADITVKAGAVFLNGSIQCNRKAKGF